jgi:hypothetical protein
MPDTVEVAIPVEAESAAALADERERAAVGRIVSRIMWPSPDHDLLLQAMELLGADAADRGLTPDRLAAELAAHKRERALRWAVTEYDDRAQTNQAGEA